MRNQEVRRRRENEKDRERWSGSRLWEDTVSHSGLCHAVWVLNEACGSINDSVYACGNEVDQSKVSFAHCEEEQHTGMPGVIHLHHERASMPQLRQSRFPGNAHGWALYVDAHVWWSQCMWQLWNIDPPKIATTSNHFTKSSSISYGWNGYLLC